MTINSKSKCCGADVSHMGFKPQSNIPVYVCVHCDFTCDLQDQPTSRLDEVAEKCRIDIYNLHPMVGDNWKQVEALIKLAIQEYTSDLQQSLTKANEELVELRKDKERLD